MDSNEQDPVAELRNLNGKLISLANAVLLLFESVTLREGMTLKEQAFFRQTQEGVRRAIKDNVWIDEKRIYLKEGQTMEDLLK